MNSTFTPPWQRGFAPLTGSATLVLFLIPVGDAVSRSRCCSQTLAFAQNQQMAASAMLLLLQRLPAQPGTRPQHQHRLAVKMFRSDGLKTEQSLEQVFFFFQPLNTCPWFSSSVGDGCAGTTYGRLCQTWFITDKLTTRRLLSEVIWWKYSLLASMFLSASTGNPSRQDIPCGTIKLD